MKSRPIIFLGKEMKDASTQILIQFSPLCPLPPPTQWSYSLTQAAIYVCVLVLRAARRVAPDGVAGGKSGAALPGGGGWFVCAWVWMVASVHGNSGGDKSVLAIAVLVTVHAAGRKQKSAHLQASGSVLTHRNGPVECHVNVCYS